METIFNADIMIDQSKIVTIGNRKYLKLGPIGTSFLMADPSKKSKIQFWAALDLDSKPPFRIHAIPVEL